MPSTVSAKIELVSVGTMATTIRLRWDLSAPATRFGT
jgi:hypothetical protein